MTQNYENMSLAELAATIQDEFCKKNGRLLTEEEAVALTDEIRKELREEKIHENKGICSN